MTYDIPERKYTDRGAVFYADGGRPSYVNSIAVGRDGTVYTIARIPKAETGYRVDLISIALAPPNFRRRAPRRRHSRENPSRGP